MTRFGQLTKTGVTFEHQPDATLSQANPVQNTYYTVLDTTARVLIYGIGARIATTNEDIQVRITIDGQTMPVYATTLTADTDYRLLNRRMVQDPASAGWSLQADPLNIMGYLIEGRNVKVEIRKTTANGTGTLTARVVWAKR